MRSFVEELRRALDQIRTAPQLGSAYEFGSGRRHRRVLLRETQYHVYYRVVRDGHVLVVAVWSAVRGRAPRL
jgi:plasmid stabilization system protein ParE